MRKVFLFILLFMVGSLVTNGAENILNRYSWRVNADGCKGSCVKNNAGYEVKKDADSGAIVFTTVSLISLKGETTYKISWQLTSPEGKNFYALGYLPNKVKIRRPWPAGNRVYGNNSNSMAHYSSRRYRNNLSSCHSKPRQRKSCGRSHLQK